MIYLTTYIFKLIWIRSPLNSMVVEKGHPPAPPTKGAKAEAGGHEVFLAAA